MAKKNVENNDAIDSTKVYKIAKKNKKKRKKLWKIIRIIIIVLFLLVLIGGGIVAAVVYNIGKESKLDTTDIAINYRNSVVKDKDDNIIATLSGDENREIITITEMSSYLPKAFVAIEDERFYEHNGVDIKRTAAATVTYVLNGGKSSFGGSTITQQLIKNLTQEDERTWKRKVKEITRAYYLEKEFSKDQIIELYLNLIFLGGNTYGVEVASNYYFSKSASELTLAESAYLAGINNSPNYYKPFTEDETVKEAEKEKIRLRTQTVIDKMLELGFINKEEYDAAILESNEGLAFNKGEIKQVVYSYHTDAAITQVIDELKEKNEWTTEYARLYVMSGGLTIYTTQDTSIQSKMEEEFKKTDFQVASKKVKDENGNYVTAQAAMVTIDHKTGFVVGCVGGLGEKNDAFGLNRATQSVRQTGSSMKPLAVLVPGIDTGAITAGTVFDDVPTSFGNYRPKDSSAYKGLLTVRYAVGSSQNIPFVKAISVIGPATSIEYLKKLGVTSLDDEKDNGLSLALGGLTHGISPLEMAAGYSTIANNGTYIEPTFYTKVVDYNGDVVLEAEQETRRVLSEAAAYVIKEVLTQPVKAGTATNCSISGMDVAAKTGTTNDNYDKWLCGFTNYYTAAVWYGFDEHEEIYKTSGASTMWRNAMRSIHDGLESSRFSSTKPNGVVAVQICRDSGMLPTEECKNDPRGSRVYTEYFVAGTQPNETCTCHISATICNDSGLLATEYCPASNVSTRVYITRQNIDEDDSWKKGIDSEYTLTIKDTCTLHTKPMDKTAPVITLKGSKSITLKLGEEYVEEGATAKDETDGDLTSKIEISGKVDKTKAGTYTIKYTAKDLSGNKGEAIRTIIVKDGEAEGSSSSNKSSAKDDKVTP